MTTRSGENWVRFQPASFAAGGCSIGSNSEHQWIIRRIAMPSQRLYKLDIPRGWNTSKDHLSGRVLASEEPPFGLSWEDLNEEMIFVTSSRCFLAIDLGWYPDYLPEGQFRIEVVDLDDLAATYARPLREFATRSVWVAKQKMEEWMGELHANQAGPAVPPTGGPRNNG
jgi:hypothetical protein